MPSLYISNGYKLCVFVSYCLLTVSRKAVFYRVYVEFGRNIGNLVSKRILQHLQSVRDLTVRDITLFTTTDRERLINEDTSHLLLLALGNSSSSQGIISSAEISSLQPEAFRIVSVLDKRGFISIAANGRPLSPSTHTNISFNKDSVHYGAVLASYSSLELLGILCCCYITLYSDVLYCTVL
jgi:hypothetical protein